MKRKDLMKRLAVIAKEKGVEITIIEGGNHTKVRIGNRPLTVPRHREINENLARAIIKEACK